MRRKILVGILLACLMLIPTSNGFNPSLVPMGGELTPLPALLTENHPPTATTIDPASEVSIEQLLGEDWYTNRQGIVDFAQSVGTQIGVPDYDIYENSEYILIVFNTGEKMQIDEEFSISKVKLILFDKTENEFIQKRNVAYSLYLEYYLQENNEEIAESIRSEIHDRFYSRLSGQVKEYANSPLIQDYAPVVVTLAKLVPILGGCLAAGPLGCEKGALLALTCEEADFVLSTAGTIVEYKLIVNEVSDRTSDASLLLRVQHELLSTTEDVPQAIDYIEKSDDIYYLITEIELYTGKLVKYPQCRSDNVRELLHKYYKMRSLFILKELVHLSDLTVSAGSIARTASFASLSGAHAMIADGYTSFVDDALEEFKVHPTFDNYQTAVVDASLFYDHMQIACVLVKATLESNREAGKLCTPKLICIPFTDICSWELPVICLPGTGEFAAWANDVLIDLGLDRGMKVDEQIEHWRLCEQAVAGRQTKFLQRYHELPAHIDASIEEIIDPKKFTKLYLSNSQGNLIITDAVNDVVNVKKEKAGYYDIESGEVTWNRESLVVIIKVKELPPEELPLTRASNEIISKVPGETKKGPWMTYNGFFQNSTWIVEIGDFWIGLIHYRILTYGEEKTISFEKVFHVESHGGSDGISNILTRAREAGRTIEEEPYFKVDKKSNTITIFYPLSSILPEDSKRIISYLEEGKVMLIASPNWHRLKHSGDFAMVGSTSTPKPAQNHPPTATRIEPASEEVSVNVGDEITFKIRAEDEDGDLHMVQWEVNGVYQKTDSLATLNEPNLEASADFSSVFEESSTVKAIVYDEQMEEASITWEVNVANVLTPTKMSLQLHAAGFSNIAEAKVLPP
jgi:hypothetical protein